MPPKRQSNVSLLSTKTRPQSNARSRSFGAKSGPSSHGHARPAIEAQEDREPHERKRRRIDSDTAGNSKSTPKTRRERANDGSDSEKLDVDGGSDSEGNEWRLGQMGSDDDSDIDSDEAFGEDDEDKFEGFAFRGSSSTKSRSKSNRQAPGKPIAGDLNLEEGEGSEGTEGGSEEDDDLGEDAVDLAAMLDESDGENEPKAPRSELKDGLPSGSSEDDEEEDIDDQESQSTFSQSDEEPDNQEASRMSALQSLVASLQPDSSESTRERFNDLIESKSPSEFGLTASQKLTVADLIPSVTDPSMKRSLKLLAADKAPKASKSSGGIPGKLDVPLARRQQDRIDRIAAYEKSKQTLERWIDTVKQNRRAEHLTFPMVNAEDLSAKSNKQMAPLAGATPQNELESTIQNILVESGLSTSNTKNDEEKLQAFEELESKKVPLEEVQARRTQLRMARELLFREEARSKRIKKIKSKSYRRVHRKQRERAEQEERTALDAAGVGLSDEEELAHRRRANERMGARHRESKWAKGVKASGRGAWDEDARAGVSEMARKGDELTQRIQGKAVRNRREEGSDFGSLSDSSSSNSDSDDEDGGVRRANRLGKKLNGLETKHDSTSGGGSGLSSMKFMQRAEAARAQENNEAVAQLRRELAGEESSTEEEPQDVGRRLFGPKTTEVASDARKKPSNRNEFEEREDSEDDALQPLQPSQDKGDGIGIGGVSGSSNTSGKPSRQQHKADQKESRKIGPKHTASMTQVSDKGAVTQGHLARDPTTSAEHEKAHASSGSTGPKAPANVEAWPVVSLEQANDNSDSDDEGIDRPTAPVTRDQQELRLRAFAGDDVEDEFEKEKKLLMEEEDDQVIDQTLPGWGNWTGTGISKRQQKRNKGRVTKTIAGVAPGKRRDAKMDKVMMNEKRIKKNDRYLAGSLPHPFESRQQYERSLRLPVGPEWTTKETFQDATKPRVMVKQGIIAPLKKPMVGSFVNASPELRDNFKHWEALFHAPLEGNNHKQPSTNAQRVPSFRDSPVVRTIDLTTTVTDCSQYSELGASSFTPTQPAASSSTASSTYIQSATTDFYPLRNSSASLNSSSGASTTISNPTQGTGNNLFTVKQTSIGLGIFSQRTGLANSANSTVPSIPSTTHGGPETTSISKTRKVPNTTATNEIESSATGDAAPRSPIGSKSIKESPAVKSPSSATVNPTKTTPESLGAATSLLASASALASQIASILARPSGTSFPANPIPGAPTLSVPKSTEVSIGPQLSSLLGLSNIGAAATVTAGTLESSNESGSIFTLGVASSFSSIEDLSSTQSPTIMASNNIFVPVATNAPPSNVPTRGDHPAPRLGIATQKAPLETNKFYANFFLGAQAQSTFTHPYSVSWSKGTGSLQSWGLSISHVEASQRAFGPGNPASYFINPIGIQSMILSATELGSSTTLSTDSLAAFSANVNLLPKAGASTSIQFPLVQGMGFVTGKYNGLTAVIQSGVFFKTVTQASYSKTANTVKYNIALEDGTSWLLYATASSGSNLSLKQSSNSLLQASGPFTGTIQVAKNPGGANGETIYDASAGVYATAATISGSVSGSQGTYSLSWTKAGAAGTKPKLLMFALPHMVDSFDSNTNGAKTGIQLQTTTKGMATATVGDSWTMVEPKMPTDMGFAPWDPSSKSQPNLSSGAVSAIKPIASSEVGQDMNAQTNLNSMYYSGKGLSKFATIIYTIHDVVKDTSAAKSALDKLKDAYAVFVNNKQQYPLVRETAWGGVVSSASYETGDSGADFGNTYYNDHHFHYGYFIHAAAIIGYLDPSWLSANKDYVNMLVRDASNPSTDDSYFPMFRSFDWYHGHSFAKGLFESGDGKDEESTSEDAMFAYAVKMWGKTVGDANMEARGNLMLSVVARSLQNYFLMESSNKNQPSNFIGNKVTGILFENKIDHTTYFGTNPEYIEGIHMIPLLPFSALTRTKNFVNEEWSTYFDKGRVDQVDGGWRGILYANLAITDPATSYKFFSQPNFDAGWLDGGASQTWYLAYAAGLGGGPSPSSGAAQSSSTYTTSNVEQRSSEQIADSGRRPSAQERRGLGGKVHHLREQLMKKFDSI
ncbi:MAG: hypothetical protein M4579_000862 [Chaenotheca gracillima]|nr:MAG: hypothetical protein M4579_000862 [Chaenotheca gracillima]